MKPYIIVRRLILLVFVMIGVSMVTFTISHLIPADPAIYAAGNGATPEQIQALRHEMGLDLPPVEQYVRYITGLLHGDFGTSILTRQSVLTDLKTFLPATIELVVIAYIFMAILGLAAGVLSAVYSRRWGDYLSRIPIIAGTGIPVFWLALMCQLLLYYRWGLLPYGDRLATLSTPPPTVTGFYLVDSLLSGNLPLFREAALHLIMPALVLAIDRAAIITRIMRASMLETLNQDFIRTARAKGLTEWTIITRHAVKVAFIPVLTELGLEFGWMLASTVVIESIFGWPGIGRYAFTAIESHDLNAVMGVTLVLTLVKTLSNLVVDVLYQTVDPRIRY